MVKQAQCLDNGGAMIRRYWLAILATFALCAVVQVAIAGQSLYSGKTWVGSEDNSLDNAFARVLKQVLVKVSGYSDISSDQQVNEALVHAREWLQRYHYLNNPGQNGSQQWVWVQFDPHPLNALLKRTKHIAWTTPRSKTLIWFLLDHDGNQQVLKEDDDMPLAKQFDQLLNQRGLPYVFPKMDEHDQWLLQSKALWRLQTKQIMKASSRYHSDQVAVIKMVFQPHDKAWHVAMHVLNRVGEKVIILQNPSLSQLLIQLSDGLLTQTYAAASLIDTLQQQTVAELDVTGINSMEDYQSLMDVLRKQPLVKEISLQGLFAHGVYLKLNIAGSDSHFFRNLMATQELTSLGAPTIRHGKPRVWQFTWPARHNANVGEHNVRTINAGHAT